MDFINNIWSTINNLINKNHTVLSKDELDYHPTPIILIAEAFLLILSILNIFTIIMVAFIILKSIQFHINFIALIINLFLEGIIYLICRIILIIRLFNCVENCFDNGRFMFSSSLIVVDLIRLTVGIGYISAMLFVFFERAMATIYLSTYEKSTSYLFIFRCFVGQYLWGAVFTFLVYKAFGEFGCIIFSLSFIFFDRINQRLYRKSTTVGNSYTLSQRYQLAENIRSANLMKKSVVVYTIFNSFIILMFGTICLVENQSGKIWVYFAYELAISIYCFAFPGVAIYSCDPWKKIFFQILRKTIKLVRCKRDRVEDMRSAQGKQEKLKTADGGTMVFTAEQEGSIYFTQLQQLWK